MSQRLIVIENTAYSISDENLRDAMQIVAEMNSEDILLDEEEFGMTKLDYMPEYAIDLSNLNSQVAYDTLTHLHLANV